MGPQGYGALPFGCLGYRGSVSRETAGLRLSRGLSAARLAARGGARYAASAPRLFAAAGEQRQQLRNDLALRTAEDIAETLGSMKGVLMKIGQLASYVDDGLNPQVRRTLSRLQDSVPPMSAELAAGVIEADLGAPPDELFEELRRHLDDVAVLELTYITTLYFQHAVMSKALRTEFDDRDDPIVEVPGPLGSSAMHPGRNR